MATVADVLYSVFPSNSATGVVLTDTIRVTFTLEIDEQTLEHGGFILEGPDTDEVIHNVYLPQTLVPGSESQILESPGYNGIVPGTFTFVRLDPLVDSVADINDVSGNGTLYRTRVIFKPSIPLAPDTEYVLYLVGDEDTNDSTEYGIKPRTVFDTVADGGNTGTGTVYFSGSYTGTVSNDVLNIRITNAGVPGQAEFEWWRDSTVLDVSGPVLSSIGTQHLVDGVNIRFDSAGMLNLGDEFTVVLKKQLSFTSTYYTKFTTGGGSISEIPTSVSTSPLGDPVSTSATALSVVKITPEANSTNLSSDKYKQIVVEFNSDLDLSTVNDGTVTVFAEAVTDHPNLSITSPNDEVAKTITASGRFLYIDL